MLLDRIGPPRRCRGGVVMIYWFRRPALTCFIRLTRAGALMARPWSARCYGVAWQREGSRQNSKTRRLLTNRPCSSLVYEESDSKERLRVSNWIVQRLYNYAVKKTVEL